MGCGSSAAALLAGVLLANHFGGADGDSLGWTGYQAMEEACSREGHPDNVAACWLGGMTASAMELHEGLTHVLTASLRRSNAMWGLMVVLPSVGLATDKARSLLPERYDQGGCRFKCAAYGVARCSLRDAAGRPASNRDGWIDCISRTARRHVLCLPMLMPVRDFPGVLGVRFEWSRAFCAGDLRAGAKGRGADAPCLAWRGKSS